MKEVVWELAMDSDIDIELEEEFLPGGDDFVAEIIDGNSVDEPVQ